MFSNGSTGLLSCSDVLCCYRRAPPGSTVATQVLTDLTGFSRVTECSTLLSLLKLPLVICQEIRCHVGQLISAFAAIGADVSANKFRSSDWPRRVWPLPSGLKG